MRESDLDTKSYSITLIHVFPVGGHRLNHLIEEASVSAALARVMDHR